MFAVGHLALGYLTGKGSAKILSTKINLPLILTLSIIPDIDILFWSFIEHRGPTHSIIVTFAAFLPFFAFYRKRAIPYYVALIQHFLLGDLLSGNGSQLLWPFTTQTYGLVFEITSPINVTIETAAFLGALVVMLKTRDLNEFFRPRKRNLILAIPAFTVLLPSLLGFPLRVPLDLLPQHLTLMILFTLSILIELVEPFSTR